jgi:hypothetical protein
MKDKIGKIYIEYPPLRQCLACEQLFSRERAAEHARVPCFPQADRWFPTMQCGTVGTA